MKGLQSFLNTPAGSWVKVFLSAMATFVLDHYFSGNDLFAISWRSILAAGLGAVMPIIINALNPKDARYGSKAK